tara:strand:+ start:4098 stop:4331 length:234 start_codon:yes stop_codon:yes gene_type:complete
MSDIIKFPTWIRQRQNDLDYREEMVRKHEVEIEFEKAKVQSDILKIKREKVTSGTRMLASFCAGIIVGMVIIMFLSF